jgi:3-deoxy-D-manno-octulosonic acid (KDO) 8-phosphate synthase
MYESDPNECERIGFVFKATWGWANKTQDQTNRASSTTEDSVSTLQKLS